MITQKEAEKFLQAYQNTTIQSSLFWNSLSQSQKVDLIMQARKMPGDLKINLQALIAECRGT